MSDDQNPNGTPPNTAPEAQTFKGLNSLVTRDPEAMEHTPQDAAYAGAAPTPDPRLNAGLEVIEMASAGLGVNAVAADLQLTQAESPNAGYTPPSQMAPVHQPESVSDLPGGAPEQQHLDSLE